MNPFSAEKMGQVTSSIFAECLTLADEIGLTTRDLATLCASTPATLYRWKKLLDAGNTADPEGKMPTAAFLNLLIFRKEARAAKEAGLLPKDGKRGARQWARDLAPELFDSSAE